MNSVVMRRMSELINMISVVCCIMCGVMREFVIMMVVVGIRNKV